MDRELYRYYILDREHRKARKECEINFGEEYVKAGLDYEERIIRRFETAMAREEARIQPTEKIVFVRTNGKLKDVLTDKEWEERWKVCYVHEMGYAANFCVNYQKVITKGLVACRDEASDAQKRAIDAIIKLSDKYLAEAERMGREDVAETLRQVPRYPARNFREALQFFRILHFSLWMEGDYHNTVGRFDQYMYPYFQKDIENGVYTRESALELVEDFFLSFNKDSDLYSGVQQGDNGQSLMLGGIDLDGNDHFNLLSELCLEASRELKLIDPKINLRVSKKTPLDRYEKGTELTKVGLGFPQYCNDDVVIPGLIRLGYAPEDAVNYTVAACWEFIIPGVGNDIPNIGAVNFPKIVDRTLRKNLGKVKDFDVLLGEVRKEIRAECDEITANIGKAEFLPSPVMDLLRDERKYNNYGLHGISIAGAADALAGVEKYVFGGKVTPERLLSALDTNYENDPELLHLLRYEAPKMGAGSARADEIGGVILSAFADALEGKKNAFGGIWRAGTGTAMYYLWSARDVGATADGRRNGEPMGTNFSPNLFTRVPGPVTDIDSFTANDLTRIVNGGPLTLEFASGIFNDPANTKKVALLVRHFVERGGHQLQLNAVNADELRDAQIHPEAHRQLVVRIWGWSAYFVELDKEYQDHVLARQRYVV